MEDIEFAPQEIVFACLRVLHAGGVWTRNQAIAGEEVSIERIGELWEALHPVPGLLHRWRSGANDELTLYWRSYDQRWDEPRLEETYAVALEEFRRRSTS